MRRVAPLLLALALPVPADAAFPGRNGKVAYVGEAGGRTTLLVRQGSSVRGVLDGGAMASPAWSPQGRRIALVRATPAGKELWTLAHDGQGVRQVTDAPQDVGSPAWSPSGAEIAYAGAGEIHVVSADGGTTRTLTAGTEPAWGARGRIAFVARGDVWTIASTGGKPRRLARTRGPERSPTWSPDGGRLAYVRGGALWTMRADGKRRRPVLRGPVSAPAWSPDGRRLLVSAGPPGRRRIVSVSPSGTRPNVLSTPSSDGRDPDWQPTGFDPVVAAAGDIACDPEGRYYNGGLGVPRRCGQLRTSNLLLQQDLWQVLPLGDNQYQQGELSDYMAVYDTTWGRTKYLQRPVIGNHEYASGGVGHFDYFNGTGELDGPAGPRERGGYYSFDVGTWHVVALNSECAYVPGGCDAGSPQQQWLAADLQAHPARCTMAIWHTPRYSSYGGGARRLDALWDTFAAAGGDVVLSGHHHFYERLAPVDGVRQFVVGTGGGSIRTSEGELSPYSQVKHETTFGILSLRLGRGEVEWRFRSASADPATDHGIDRCD